MESDPVKQVFPTFDFLGWYSVGSTPTPADMAIHKQVRKPLLLSWDSQLTHWSAGQFFEHNETPLFLQLSSITSTKELPVAIYESAIELVNQAAEVVFIKASYEIATGEAERVAVDHVSKPSTAGGGSQSSSKSASVCQD